MGRHKHTDPAPLDHAGLLSAVAGAAVVVVVAVVTVVAVVLRLLLGVFVNV